MTQVTRTVIELDNNNAAQALAGEQDAHLKILERRLDCTLTLRGNVLKKDARALEIVDLLCIVRAPAAHAFKVQRLEVAVRTDTFLEHPGGALLDL